MHCKCTWYFSLRSACSGSLPTTNTVTRTWCVDGQQLKAQRGTCNEKSLRAKVQMLLKAVKKSGRLPKIEEYSGILIALDILVRRAWIRWEFFTRTSSLSNANTSLCWALNDDIGDRQSPRPAGTMAMFKTSRGSRTPWLGLEGYKLAIRYEVFFFHPSRTGSPYNASERSIEKTY